MKDAITITFILAVVTELAALMQVALGRAIFHWDFWPWFLLAHVCWWATSLFIVSEEICDGAFPLDK